MFTIYIALDTFVIKRVYKKINNVDSINKDTSTIVEGDVTSSDDYYKDDNIEISLKKYRQYDTDIYVADIIVSDSSYLKTAFASNSYGKNVVDKTSNIANSNNAIIAINGDYYGVQEDGYVLKGGVIYRNTKRSNQEDLVIYEDGTFEIINENDISLEQLVKNGAYNILSFGPGLINNGVITVDENTEVDKSMRSNPRTAIGMIDTNHYVFVVSDGRTSASEGLSLFELATFMNSLNCDIAYNLDGGGSSTMYFNGSVVNNPTTNGRIKEGSVADIVYIGY